MMIMMYHQYGSTGARLGRRLLLRRASSSSSSSSWAPPAAAFECDLRHPALLGGLGATGAGSRPLRDAFVPSGGWGPRGARVVREAGGTPGGGAPEVWRSAAHRVMTSVLGFTHGDAAARLSTRHMVALHAGVAAALLSREPADAAPAAGRGVLLLDVGAATGATTAELAGLFTRVVATDASRACVDVLAQRPEIDMAVHTDRLLAEEFGGQSRQQLYDVVALLNVLDRCSDPEQLLSEARSLLLPAGDGGQLLLGFAHPLSAFVQPQGLSYFRAADDHSRVRAFFGDVRRDEEFEAFVGDIERAVLAPRGLCVERWTRFPYACSDERGGWAWMDQLLMTAVEC